MGRGTGSGKGSGRGSGITMCSAERQKDNRTCKDNLVL